MCHCCIRPCHASNTAEFDVTFEAHSYDTARPCHQRRRTCAKSVLTTRATAAAVSTHLEQEDQILGRGHGALHQHDQGAERVLRQPSQPRQPCSGQA